MRLKKVVTDYDKSLLVPGTPPPHDVRKALMYRPDLWGRPFARAMQDVMRGPSAWSPGERELMAAYVSRRNLCPY